MMALYRTIALHLVMRIPQMTCAAVSSGSMYTRLLCVKGAIAGIVVIRREQRPLRVIIPQVTHGEADVEGHKSTPVEDKEVVLVASVDVGPKSKQGSVLVDWEGHSTVQLIVHQDGSIGIVVDDEHVDIWHAVGSK